MRSKRFLITFLTAVVIIAGTLVAIQFAKGYRPGQKGILQGTGLLAANSFPNGAQVYLNGKLTTATDNTLNLEPGTYDIQIKKDGYVTWEKSLRIENELVTQTNAVLFPSAPSLTPLTFTGASNLSVSPDGQKIAFYVASASAQAKNGLYVLDLTDSMLSLQHGPRQIAQAPNTTDFAKAKLLWSPDSAQILVSYDGHNLLLDPNRMNSVSDAQDITYQLPTVFSQWEEDLYKRERTRLAKFPDAIQYIATASAKNVYFSPDDYRILYTATASAHLADTLVPPVPSSNTQVQERTLQAGGTYVYDRYEDRNFRVGSEILPSPVPGIKSSTPALIQQLLANDLFTTPRTLAASPSAFKLLQGKTPAETIANFQLHYSNIYTGNLQWYPDSKHLIGIKDTAIILKEYDGTNESTIFAGSLVDNFIYPWPNGSKLIILTNFHQSLTAPVNLYAITLK
ncbi:MAG TPA: PEGA domain-containing protein [Candidatus Saccharimonadia bacterium]|nr:PEGA domain-containing protein [Candidatus Saccharimonadia bacterium]